MIDDKNKALNFFVNQLINELVLIALTYFIK